MACLTSYRGELHYATIYSDSKPHLRDMLKVCANARLRLKAKTHSIYGELNRLGSQLEEIYMSRYPNAPVTAAMRASGWSSCFNVKRVTFVGSIDMDIRAFFQPPKPHLEVLQMG